MRPTTFPAVLIASAGIVFAGPAHAQTTGVAGTVTEMTSGRPLHAARISIPALGADQLTDRHGKFLLTDLPAGSHELQATLIGYEQAAATVEAAAGETVEIEIAMAVSSINLEGITVVTGTAFEEPPISLPSAVAVSLRRDLIEQGSPQPTDFFKNLSASHGIIGERSSWYNATGALVPETAASINLRGLGASRTLVLLNGRRQVYLPVRLIGGRFVDVNAIPAIAVGRIEVLKEGASAVYGSDAVGGVVNFVTRNDLEGAEIAVSHDYFAGAGDTGLGAIFGTAFGDGHRAVIAGEWARRQQLAPTERDWALRGFVPGGGAWSGTGNPGAFLMPALTGNETAEEFVAALTDAHFGENPSIFIDPNCTDFGGHVEAWTCRFRYQPWDNLIEATDHFRSFAEIQGSLGSRSSYRLEGLWAEAVIPAWVTTPSFPPISPYDGLQIVAPGHPGRRHFCSSGEGGFASPAECLEDDWFYFGRLVGNSGPGREFRRASRTRRLALSLERDFETFGGRPANFDLALAYARSNGNVNQPAEYAYRKFLAFRGFGGPDCGVEAVVDRTAPSGMALGPLNGAVAGQGSCEYFNPFSSSLERSAQPGSRYASSANPGYAPELANSPEMIAWINEEVDLSNTADLFVADATLTGTWIDNAFSYALGYQFRTFDVTSTPNAAGNLEANPCPVPGDRGCREKAGPYTFTTGYYPYEDAQTVHRLFTEFPLRLGRFDAHFASNYEIHETVRSFDPKFSLRANLVGSDSYLLSLRGSLQTTFRTPSVDDLNEDRLTSLEYIPVIGTYKALDTYGNKDLEPERAFTYNAGLILLLEKARFTLDYWIYDFKDVINVQPFSSITALYDQGGAARDAVKHLITCPDGTGTGTCDIAQVERIRVGLVNWPGITTSGFDFHAETQLPAGSAEVAVGLSGTYTHKYDVKALNLENLELQPAVSGAGALNRNSPLAWPLPDLKGRFFAKYSRGDKSLTGYLNYISSYSDLDSEPEYQNIDNFVTFDLNLRIGLANGVDAVLSGFNLLDADPPLVNWEASYDGFTHDPKGRRLKLSLMYTLGFDH